MSERVSRRAEACKSGHVYSTIICFALLCFLHSPMGRRLCVWQLDDLYPFKWFSPVQSSSVRSSRQPECKHRFESINDDGNFIILPTENKDICLAPTWSPPPMGFEQEWEVWSFFLNRRFAAGFQNFCCSTKISL